MSYKINSLEKQSSDSQNVTAQIPAYATADHPLFHFVHPCLILPLRKANPPPKPEYSNELSFTPHTISHV